MKITGQYKIINCEKSENGTKLTLEDFEGKKIEGTYNLENLPFEQMQKLIGQQISCSRENGEFNVHKAWDGETPTFCDDKGHATDDLIL